MDAPLALGFDLGGTQLRAALVRNGKIIKRAALPTDVAGGPEAVMRQFQHIAQEVCGEKRTSISAIGVASPGPLDTKTGVIISIATLPGWEHFPLAQRLTQLFRVEVVVENDGIAAAHGEWKHGAGQGVDNLVYATVSTGLGGGVVVDGKLLHGRRGMAAHIGHMRIGLDGPRCSCGRTGCFEALASGTALGLRAQAIAHASKGWLGNAASKALPGARDVVEGARANDAECLALLLEEARFLGIGFANLLHLYSPDLIIMGGGVSQAYDLLEAEIHATIKGEALDAFREIRVVPAALADNAGLMGAASLALEAILARSR